MRTTHSFVFEEVLSPSVRVEDRWWNTISAAKVALLLTSPSCVGVSLEVIGFHGLLAVALCAATALPLSQAAAAKLTPPSRHCQAAAAVALCATTALPLTPPSFRRHRAAGKLPPQSR